MGQNTIQTSDAQFDADVLKSSIPVLVDFWAAWCGPCKAIAPKLEEIGGEMAGKVKIVKVDVDNNQNTSARFGIRSIPTLMLFKNGQAVDQIMGNHPKEKIVEFITRHL